MYQFQPQFNNNNNNNDYNNETIHPSYPSVVKQQQQDLAFTFTTEDLLLTPGYYMTPPMASPSSHYSNESYFSPIEQSANFDFFPVVQQCTTMYDYWSSNQSSPMYTDTQSSPVYSTVNQSSPTYTTTQSPPTYATNPTPLSSSSTSLCSTTSTISSYSVEEKQTESKLYACHTCGRAFARKHDLQRHIRVHTGEKPYACPCCNKAFARTDALKRHLRMEEQCRTSHQVQTMKNTGKRRYRNL